MVTSKVTNRAGGTPDALVAKACLLIPVENNRSLPRRRQPQNLNLFKFKFSVGEVNGNDAIIETPLVSRPTDYDKPACRGEQLFCFPNNWDHLRTALWIASPQNDCVPPELADFVITLNQSARLKKLNDITSCETPNKHGRVGGKK